MRQQTNMTLVLVVFEYDKEIQEQRVEYKQCTSANGLKPLSCFLYILQVVQNKNCTFIMYTHRL